MRIAELYFKAYGPFTEHRIELRRGGAGLHVIFGRNEAGKSSALRAIHHLLYGIPARSADNFIHDYRNMRIGGRLAHSEGGEIAFLRKKGSKNTLRSWDDAEPVDDASLEPFVRGVPEELFRSFFGIDHTTLLDGGQSLLDDKGDVGRSLFAAGLGSGNPRRVISSLDEEAKALFAPRAKIARVNAGLSELHRIRSEIKAGSLKPREWKAHERDLAEAEAELLRIEIELGELGGERSRLERIASARPGLARRQHLLDSITAMGAPTPLDEGFDARLHDALETRGRATRDRRLAREALEQLDRKLAELLLEPALLQQREAIASYRERFGKYKAAREDVPRREGERELLSKELAADLANLGTRLGADELDELRAPLTRRRQIEDLADEHGKLQTLAESASKTLRQGSQKQEGLRAEFAALPPARDAAGLRRALTAARNLGDVDAQARGLTLRCEGAERSCRNDLSALGLWTGGLEELERLAVPSMEAIERFQGDYDALAKEREKLEDRQQGVRGEIRDVEARLAALQRSGAVPSEDELTTERERRDTGWRLVRRRWVDGEAISPEIEADIESYSGGDPLPDVYERSVASADGVADRLRLDAERVAAQAELVDKHAHAGQVLEEIGDSLSRIEVREDRLAETWRGAWREIGIEPNSPREMLAWLRRQQDLAKASADARGLRSELRAVCEGRATCRDGLLAELRSLDEALEESGDELSEVVFLADEVLQSLDAIEKQRTELKGAQEESERSLEEARHEEREARQGLAGWREEWSAAVEGLGLSEGARPAEARDRLQTIGELFQKRREIESLDSRIASMSRDIEELEGELADFVAAHVPELAGQAVDQSIHRLAGMLSEIDKQETLRGRLLEESERESEKARHAEHELEEAERELSSLQEEARCSDIADLEEALRRWKEWQRALESIDDIEGQLVESSGGASLAQLETEAGEVDIDDLPGRLEALQLKIDELAKRRDEVRDQRVSARRELERMDGSARVADAAEEAQEVLATLRRDVERYVELRLARVILEREIERYRGEHQAPLLVRAQELFAELTLGSYTALQTDYDEDRPQLTAVRSDDRRTVGVGEMSSGTRDQLFLALRLATLEEYLERSEPMPFIVDDILVNFDDERARATLEVLADLSTRTQVLLFTHHGRVRDHARELGERASLLELGES